MERLYELEQRGKDLYHAQTGRAVLNIKKLKSIANDQNIDFNIAEIARRKLLILERDQWACVWCKETQCLTIDHIISLKVIGQFPRRRHECYTMENTQVLCAWCHNEKDGPCINFAESQK